MSKREHPPKLRDGDDFEDWLRDVEIWKLGTNIDKKQWGAVTYMALEGKAKRCCKNIPISQIEGEGGYKNVITKLKALYGIDEGLQRFLAIERFEEYVRPDDLSVVDFINEWEARYDRVKALSEIQLPEDYLAYKLFKAVQISDDNKLLTRATITTFKVDEAKEKLKAIFTMQSLNKSLSETNSGELEFKVEPEEIPNTLYANNRRWNGREAKRSGGS